MKYNCEKCHDTGSRDKSGEYPDCVYCQAAMQRVALMDWLLLECRHQTLAQSAWAIHQRALSMAADHFNGVIKMVPAAAPQVVADERAAFETWAKSNGFSTKSYEDRNGISYELLGTRAYWIGWDARAALQAAPVQPVAVPDGWKLVLVEPTREMLEAWVSTPFESRAKMTAREVREGRAKAEWQAMLVAAPAAPAAQGDAIEDELTKIVKSGAEKDFPGFLEWIADRLVYVHSENNNVDYVQTLRTRAKQLRAAIAAKAAS